MPSLPPLVLQQHPSQRQLLVLLACSTWTVLRLKERLVKLLMEHSQAHQTIESGARSKVS